MLLTPISLTSSGARSQPYGLLRTLFFKPQFPNLKNLPSSWDLEGGLLSGVFFLYLSTSFPTQALLGSWFLQLGVRSKNH